MLEARAFDNIYRHFDELADHFMQPDAWSILANLIYWTVLLLIALAKALSLAVIAFGLIASAVCGLLGPIFVPFFIVPKLEWLFWGWLKSFIQYPFIPVVAIAFLMIFEQFVFRYVTTLPPTITSAEYRRVRPAGGGGDCDVLRRDGPGPIAHELDLLGTRWPDHDFVRPADPPPAVARRKSNAKAILQRSRSPARASRSRDPGVLERLLRRDRDRDSLRPGERRVVDRVAAAERPLWQMKGRAMNATVADLNPKTLDSAKRQFVELYGSALVMNTYLKIALVLVSLVALGLLGLNFHTTAKYSQVKPLVIRIDDVGRAEAVQYDAAGYQPQAPEMRYFLTQFIVKHFSRLRATVQREYPDSLFFLEPALADATIAQNEQSRVLETFLTNPSADEVDIVVQNVSLSELAKPPYKASVSFQKLLYSPGTRQERARQTFIAQIDFSLRDHVPNEFIRVNPLGLQVSYFRVDQAFEEAER